MKPSKDAAALHTAMHACMVDGGWRMEDGWRGMQRWMEGAEIWMDGMFIYSVWTFL
jgi:hypothetical protein